MIDAVTRTIGEGQGNKKRRPEVELECTSGAVGIVVVCSNTVQSGDLHVLREPE